MKTVVTKAWEHIFFECEDKNGNSSSVELILNHREKTFDIHSQNEDSVSFKKITLEESKCRTFAILAALNHVEQTYKSEQ